MVQFRPMLSAKLKKNQTYETILPTLDWHWGMYASPKLDGIRIVVHPELGAVTRSLKKIRNEALAEFMKHYHDLLMGFDGEMILGDHESHEYSFQKTTSAVMSHDGVFTGLQFHVFDDMSYNDSYRLRLAELKKRFDLLKDGHPVKGFVKIVPQELITNVEDCFKHEQRMLELGYEGSMIRHPLSKYKQGRSTMREQGLIAVKRFYDCEAIIKGIEPLYRNENEAVINELGYTERSSSKENKVADDLMGRILVEGCENTPFAGMEFYIGSGFTEAQREEFWHNSKDYVGRKVTFKYQPAGIKDKPRIPIFKGFRDDM